MSIFHPEDRPERVKPAESGQQYLWKSEMVFMSAGPLK